MRTNRAPTWFAFKKTFTNRVAPRELKFVNSQVHFFYGHFEEGEYVELTGEEAKHARVLRLKPGELVGLQDGIGGIRVGETVSGKTPKVVFKILRSQTFPPPTPGVHLAVSLLKDRDRMEWLLEKLTELGIMEFTPLTCDHTEKPGFNKVRWENIINSAFKQCGRAWRPVLRDQTGFEQFVQKPFIGHKYIALQSGPSFTHRSVLFPGNQVLCCIGPEGDFSNKEKVMAGKYGFEPVSFGSTRYRTETAALIAGMWMSLFDPR